MGNPDQLRGIHQGIIRCVRCNRILKHPVWHNGVAYGKVCFEKKFHTTPKKVDKDNYKLLEAWI